MVAYNFKKQFAEKVRDGSKCQTVRGQRDRHANPGEAVQLYTGMRTKQCDKLIPDSICTSVSKVVINNNLVMIDGWILWGSNLEKFAIADGFANYADFLAFFKEVHRLPFEGVLIKWESQLIPRLFG